MPGRYFSTIDRNGTENEIAIHAPDGRAMMFIQFWGEEGEAADQVKADAKLIVDALNLIRSPRKKLFAKCQILWHCRVMGTNEAARRGKGSL